MDAKCNGHIISHSYGDNDISNLECISYSEHHKKHWEENREYLTEKVRENIKKAGEWRKTEEGKKYYGEHAKDVWKNSPKHMRKCIVCQEEFECFERTNRKSCSRACRHEIAKKDYREIRVCVICKKKFESYKHNRTCTCSKACRLAKFRLTRSQKNGMASK